MRLVLAEVSAMQFRSYVSDSLSSHPPLGRSVTIDQAAQLIGVSRRTVYYRIREGRLRTIRTLGGSQRVLVESLQELVLSH
jgi:excisionase family DNA binding protein